VEKLSIGEVMSVGWDGIRVNTESGMSLWLDLPESKVKEMPKLISGDRKYAARKTQSGKVRYRCKKDDLMLRLADPDSGFFLFCRASAMQPGAAFKIALRTKERPRLVFSGQGWGAVWVITPEVVTWLERIAEGRGVFPVKSTAKLDEWVRPNGAAFVAISQGDGRVSMCIDGGRACIRLAFNVKGVFSGQVGREAQCTVAA
jgi:hypothetical protein